ncbi:MAG TPA: alpha/beta fold hydrolase [Silvibacterium sp.]|nr:alpha/beta fold hydrolase [Silvibacterium sp.]
MTTIREFADTSSEAPVRGFLHLPDARPDGGLVLTHGAGANCKAPLLAALADGFCAAGIAVLRCDLPFRQLRPQGPPPRGSAERDRQGLRAAVEAIGREVPGRIFLGGHSYGGRQASMLAASDPGLVPALLLLSYPLHPPQRPSEMRTTHFPGLTTPALFVSGIRDGFGSPDEMEAALRLIPARTELLSVPSAGHELMTKRNREELSRLVVESFLGFVEGSTGD